MCNVKLKLLITLAALIILSFVFNAKESKGFNNNTVYDVKSSFIIDHDVSFYRDGESLKLIQKLNYFDPIIIVFEDMNKKGRIKVKLQSGNEGWVEEKYTSYIPNNWQKLQLIDNYYFFMLPDLKMDLQKEEGKNIRIYRYRSIQYYISMGIILINDYKTRVKNRLDDVTREISIGKDKMLNWNKEFTFGNYKINYTITTMHHDGDISESFDFVKLDEMNLTKYYYVTVDYSPDASAEKKLMQRKILFSALQSLR